MLEPDHLYNENNKIYNFTHNNAFAVERSKKTPINPIL